jgi:hypothetical protein
LVDENEKVLLRKVDIVDWDSDAAKQAHQEFKLDAIPYLRVYNGAGKLVSEISGGDIDEVKIVVRAALAQ